MTFRRSLKYQTLLLALVLLMSFNLTAQVKDTPYFQEIKTTITLPEAAGKEIVKMFSVAEKQIVVTKSGISSRFNGSWTFNSRNGNWQTATIDQDGKLWLAMSNSIQTEDSKLTIALPETAKNDTILCLFVDGKTWFAGTTNGLYAYDNNFELISATKGKRIYAIAKGAKNDWWIGTDKGLLHQLDGKWVNLDDNLMANGLKQNYFSLASANNNQDILFGGLFSVGCIAANGNNWLFRGTDGLPYGPVTTIKPIANKIWIGTPNGAILKDESWHYYAGKRWLSNNKIIDILPIDRHTVWIATPEGISQIQEVQITLEEKAAKFEERIRLRHDRHGQVSKSVLKIPGDLTTSYTINDDNDGLWTSIYLAAECFRYATTKDPEAKKNAIKTYLAMERLETITGIPGFPARSIVAINESTGEGGEWHPTPDKKWKWKGDTSSDELVGHMFAYPLFYDLVAEGEMKTRVKNLVQRIMGHIVDHDFHLIDLDGKPTRWAVWAPDSINFKPNWWYERGINSLQILSFLKAAYHVTGDQKF